VLTTTWVDGQTPGQILHHLRSSNAADAHTVAHMHDDAADPAGGQSADSQPGAAHAAVADAIKPAQQQQQQLLRLVDLGIQATLHQLVVTGVLHADPHPGNLMLAGDRLVYLDFGLLVRVPPQASMVSTDPCST
jgi:Ser/Thr protein kinase RdoA (MazF antagonist)